MALGTVFANLTGATGAELDTNFAQLGALTPIPCTVSGTNTVVMTPASNTPSFTAFSNYMQFSGVVAVTNTGATTINVNGIGALSAYKDTPGGPVALAGGELVAGCAFTAMYDSALNAAAGGFHIFTNTGVTGTGVSLASLSINGGSFITRLNSRSGTVGFTVVPAFSNQTVIFTLGNCSVGDVVMLGLPASVAAIASTLNLAFSGVVAATGSVAMIATNAGSVSVTPPGGNYRVAAMGLSP